MSKQKKYIITNGQEEYAKCTGDRWVLVHNREAATWSSRKKELEKIIEHKFLELHLMTKLKVVQL